jgi:glycosyltransferase involved in cell wall biosynthesis
VNRWEGAALRSGFAAATGDMVLVQDADVEYNPEDYPALLEPLMSGKADAVFGSRRLGLKQFVRSTRLSIWKSRYADWLGFFAAWGFKIPWQQEWQPLAHEP